MRLTRIVILATLSAAMLVSVTSPAVGRDALRPWLKLTPTRVHVGDRTRIRGYAGDCPAGDTVFILSRAFPAKHEFASVPAVLARVQPGGAFRASTVIPRRRRPGRYSVTGRCGGGNLGFLVTLTVVR